MKAAKKGNSDSENNLGDCYKNGIGISKDEGKLAKHLNGI